MNIPPLKKNSYRIELGRKGEDLATDFFQKQGYRILTRNFHCRYGELDLVVEKDKQIIFVEVKTRANNACGSAIEGINNLKKNKIVLTAFNWLTKYHREDEAWRIDIIAIDRATDNSFEIQHFPSAIDGEDVGYFL